MRVNYLKTAFTLAVVALLSAGMSSCKEDEEEEKGKTVQEPDLGIKGFDEKGASYAYFSVASDKIVFFSRGNLLSTRYPDDDLTDRCLGFSVRPFTP